MSHEREECAVVMEEEEGACLGKDWQRQSDPLAKSSGRENEAGHLVSGLASTASGCLGHK